MTIASAIRNTPLVGRGRLGPANGAELWLKLECLNPTGSTKNRMALAMIEGAERLGPDAAIVTPAADRASKSQSVSLYADAPG